jgi:hypothetical protein
MRFHFMPLRSAPLSLTVHHVLQSLPARKPIGFTFPKTAEFSQSQRKWTGTPPVLGRRLSRAELQRGTGKPFVAVLAALRVAAIHLLTVPLVKLAGPACARGAGACGKPSPAAQAVIEASPVRNRFVA